MFGADGQENLTHEEWLEIFDRTIASVKDELKAQGRGDEFVGARVIKSLERLAANADRSLRQILYSTIRFLSPEDLE